MGSTLNGAAASFLAFVIGACATTPPAAPSARATRLIAPMRGWYAIYREGERVGTERFEITVVEGMWRVSGTVEIDDPVEIVHGYELIVDLVSEEPLGFDVWVELAGERERCVGVVEGAHVRVDVDSIVGSRSGRVPYGPGTVVDFASPLANTLALSLLLPELVEGGSSGVRTIAIALPLLAPAVLVQRYTLVSREAELHKVSVAQDGAPGPPTALWVRKDGLPVRVRTWPEGGGAPYEMWLHEGEEGE